MQKDIVVIGASAGGIEALRILVSGLPQDFAGSLFVVIHTSANSPGFLASILERAGVLPATCVTGREPIEAGRIYVPSPDHHLLLERGGVCVTRGPKENMFRPAVDPLFRSAAQAYGPRVIGIVLTGGLDDGAAGLLAVKQLGGTTIVQDPADALAPSMPLNAMQRVPVDHCVPISQVAPLLARLTNEEVEEKGEYTVPEIIKTEVAIAREEHPLEAGVLALGAPSMFSCPECHGVLLQIKSEKVTRFRCHTGHAYSVQSLMADINEGIEDALWSAIRAIEEQMLLMQHLAEHANESGAGGTAEKLLDFAHFARQRAELVRQAVLQPDNAGGNNVAAI
jgi:two-component system, chemotaxis family, protein-glutamate methylesterase/glutaminase